MKKNNRGRRPRLFFLHFGHECVIGDCPHVCRTLFFITSTMKVHSLQKMEIICYFLSFLCQCTIKMHSKHVSTRFDTFQRSVFKLCGKCHFPHTVRKVLLSAHLSCAESGTFRTGSLNLCKKCHFPYKKLCVMMYFRRTSYENYYFRMIVTNLHLNSSKINLKI